MPDYKRHGARYRARRRAVDILFEAETRDIDPVAIEAAITPATKAIMPVHYAGLAVDMDAIHAIAQKHGLKVIEDAPGSYVSVRAA